jgi:hypothetical protein
VRRGVSGTRCWESRPGEVFHSTTAEQGGLWRHRRHAPQWYVGVGFTSQGGGCGALSANEYHNDVVRITGNVLRRFLDPQPFELPDVDDGGFG